MRAIASLKIADPSTLANIEALRRSDSDEAVRNAAGEAFLDITCKPPTLAKLKRLAAGIGPLAEQAQKAVKQLSG